MRPHVLVPVSRMHRLSLAVLLLAGWWGQGVAADRSFVTSDWVHLHYIDQGHGHTIVLIPGWTMPGWIFDAQIEAFSRNFRVIAFDPRGQGESDVAPSGYEPFRRGQDIEELLAQIDDKSPLLLGWSLGVLDALSYLHQFGDAHIAGLVLVDNSVGEGPAPSAAPRRRRPPPRRRVTHAVSMRAFVRSMFRTPQPPDYIDRLTEAALHTPGWAAAELLAYPVPRSFWKEAVYSTNKPILYLVTPKFAGQADNLAEHHPGAESVVLEGVGHAMFVDDPGRFDGLVLDFTRRVWH
jgi:microsomal epoxide hydrolase